MALDALRSTARRSLTVARRADVAVLGAALAYYGLVSVLPLTLLLMAAAAAVGSTDDGVAAAFAASVTPSLRPLLLDAVEAGAATRRTASLVGALFLAWSGSRIFAGIDTAFARVHGDGGRWGRSGRIVAASISLGSVAVTAVALTALTVLFAILPLPGEAVLRHVTPFAAVMLGLSPLYAVMSPDDLGLRDALPGAVVAAVALAVLRSTFETYVALTGGSDVYGIVGGVLLFALWLYLGATAILAGACVNEARRRQVTASSASRKPSA